MNRRGFFGTLAGLAAIPFAVGLAKVCKPKPPVFRSGYMKVLDPTELGEPIKWTVVRGNLECMSDEEFPLRLLKSPNKYDTVYEYNLAKYMATTGDRPGAST